MSEWPLQAHVAWLIFAPLITLALAIATASTIGNKWQVKPFTCVYCLTVWFGLIVAAIVYRDTPWMIPAMWPVTHIIAYIIYQRAI